jgi:5,5'-dehydrodivanillate O-demethylase
MLTAEQNRLLTEVGPGKPMGELLRRYWHPIAGVSEFDTRETKPMRLFGEDLVLYKDRGGRFGLLDRQCPHRRADLALGMAEETGLRCNYHGWLFGHDGACLAQPFEDTAHPDRGLRARVGVKAYPVATLAGMVWTYLGPAPAPELPEWEPFTWTNGFRQVVLAEIPCNWLQCQENSIDPVHFEWMHDTWGRRMKGEILKAQPHTKLGFDEFEHGFVYRRTRADTDESHPLWTIGRVCLWPNAFFLGEHFEWRVPVDDENTLSVTWQHVRVPRGREPFVQNEIPCWTGPIKDAAGNWIASHIMNQDFVAWVGQGRIADRTKEHLGASDAGIVRIRRKLLDDLGRVARGEDPKGIIRDPARARAVPLPVAFRAAVVDGAGSDKYAGLGGGPPRHYIFQAGQPAEVKAAYDRAMGFDE